MSETIDNLVEHLTDLHARMPVAIMLTGPNPIAPTCPQRGVFAVTNWTNMPSCRRYVAGTEPEGWDVMVERAAASDGECEGFVVIANALNPRGWCVVLDGDCYTPLIPVPSEDSVRETAEAIMWDHGLHDD